MAEDLALVGRRSCSRLRTRLPARVISRDATEQAVLHDLSASGARLSVFSHVEVGACLVLRCQGFEAFGEVVWSEDGQIGLQFDTELNRKILQATRELYDYQQVYQHQRLRRSAQEWVNGAR